MMSALAIIAAIVAAWLWVLGAFVTLLLLRDGDPALGVATRLIAAMVWPLLAIVLIIKGLARRVAS